MQGKYIAPGYKKGAFNCPHCDTYAVQYWSVVHYESLYTRKLHEVDHFKMAKCSYCNKFSFWLDEKLIYPAKITAPRAHDDMPKSVSGFYNEAREISVSSPRAAAALLRTAIKKLCESLGENDPNLNSAIGKLHEKGLPQDAIDALDIVRITANEGGAHEGQIDLSGKDNKQIVDKLFWLVNFIIEKTITEPKAINNMFSSLPENKKQGVEQRDKKR